MYGSANEAAINGLQQLQSQAQGQYLGTPKAATPQQEASSRWALAYERLCRAKLAMEHAQQELKEATDTERAAWGDLEVVAGRDTPKLAGANYAPRMP